MGLVTQTIKATNCMLLGDNFYDSGIQGTAQANMALYTNRSADNDCLDTSWSSFEFLSSVFAVDRISVVKRVEMFGRGGRQTEARRRGNDRRWNPVLKRVNKQEIKSMRWRIYLNRQT